MSVINPISLGTKGKVSVSGKVEPIALATFGIITVGAASIPDEGGRRRRTYFTLIGRTRLGR